MIAGSIFWAVLVAAVVVYWLLPRGRVEFLATVSLGFLLWADWSAALMLVGWMTLFYLAARQVRPRTPRAGRITAGLICAILIYLAAFKYLPEIFRDLVEDWAVGQTLLLPLGISYFTFKLIHYAIETARGEMPEHNWRQFALWMLLFPIYPAGPIERFEHFLAGVEKKWTLDSAVYGVMRIICGMIKKFFVADMVAMSVLNDTQVSTMLARLPRYGFEEVWWHLVWMFIFIYMEFSGYTDIAVGCSRLVGIRIMENFNFPFLAHNISNFWKRWHMTLSGWCMNYVYMPILGLTRNPYVAAFAIMTAIGLWHGGSVSWLAWGWYHAAGVAVWMLFQQIKRKRGWRKLDHPRLRPIGVVLTMLFVVGSQAFPATMDQGNALQSVWNALRLLVRLFGPVLPETL